MSGTDGNPTQQNSGNNTNTQLAQFKAQMEEMQRQNEEMQRKNESLSTNLQRMQNTFIENNKPRMIKAYESWQKHGVQGVDDHKEHIAKMFGEQEFAPIASLLENLTNVANGKDSELERMTKAYQEREAELKTKDEELEQVRGQNEQYQSFINKDGRYDSNNIFKTHQHILDNPLPAGRGGSMVISSIEGQRNNMQGGGGMPPEVALSRKSTLDDKVPSNRPTKRSRTSLIHPGQEELLNALNSVPLMTHGAIRNMNPRGHANSMQ